MGAFAVARSSPHDDPAVGLPLGAAGSRKATSATCAVRWALEEAGLPYEVDLVDQAGSASASYRRWQPFGQVPAYRDDEVEVFESGAIVLHIAARSRRWRRATRLAGRG